MSPVEQIEADLRLYCFPKEVMESERLLSGYMKENGVEKWVLGDCASRNLIAEVPNSPYQCYWSRRALASDKALREIMIAITGVDPADTEGVSPEEIVAMARSYVAAVKKITSQQTLNHITNDSR